MNKYNLVDCNKLCKLAHQQQIWEKLEPILKECIISLDNVKSIGVVNK